MGSRTLELGKVFQADATALIEARNKCILIHHTKDIDAAGDEVEVDVQSVRRVERPDFTSAAVQESRHAAGILVSRNFPQTAMPALGSQSWMVPRVGILGQRRVCGEGNGSLASATRVGKDLVENGRHRRGKFQFVQEPYEATATLVLPTLHFGHHA